MSLRIFVIDKEASIQDTLKIHLEDEGHEVLTASEPSDCPVYKGHQCHKQAPCGHALFISNQLGEMNGLDFIEMMENNGCKGMMRHKVLMSGNLDLVDTEKAESMGCIVLQKPVSLHTIDKIVQQVEESVPADEELFPV